LESIRRFFTQSYISFKALFGWLEPKNYVFIKIIAPIFQLIFFCLIAKYCYGSENLAPFIVGNSLLLCTSNCIFGLGTAFVADRYYGTLKNIIIMPTSKFVLLLQRGFPHAIDSLSSVIIGGCAGSLLFRINYKGVNVWLIALVILTAMFAASGLGVLMGVLSLLTSEIHILLNITNMALIALSGVNFPTKQLPSILRYLSFCLPLTRSVAAIKSILNGGTFIQIWRLVAGELLLGTLFVIAGYLVIEVIEKLAKKNASIDIY